ncbi:SOH1-domain-containing protein [Lipomyces japonicus]|uniref:SOH1-domain-containing protein n=1 Tax=Lipomyces japonicus TaxID=56871 RepID=UPI0034CEAA64
MDSSQSVEVQSSNLVQEPIPTRFEVELEFVQALANPQYINFLAQNDYLDDEDFIKYLEYLEYWRKPEYLKYLIYPNCLHVLSLLKHKAFRRDVRHADIAQMLMDDMYSKWLHVGRYRADVAFSPSSDVASKPAEISTDIR